MNAADGVVVRVPMRARVDFAVRGGFADGDPMPAPPNVSAAGAVAMTAEDDDSLTVVVVIVAVAGADVVHVDDLARRPIFVILNGYMPRAAARDDDGEKSKNSHQA